MRRHALGALLPLALLLISAPGASAATCTATSSGSWTTAGTWSCGAVPGAADTAVIPVGKTVTLNDPASPDAVANLALRGGTLALADFNELDASGFAVSGGGTVSGTMNTNLTITGTTGSQATVDAGGLTVDGTYVTIDGDGTFGIAGPLTITNGGWIESDVDAAWTGSAPWQLGGAGANTSGFDEVGAQLTIAGATAATDVGAGDDGFIQLDAGATLSKEDATTTTVNADVIINESEVDVLAGKLVGGLQGDGTLDVSQGAVLALSGSGVQLAPTSIDLGGGAIEVEPNADVELDLPSAPGLGRLEIEQGAELDVSIGDGSGGPSGSERYAQTTAIDSGATLSFEDSVPLELAARDTLSGSGTLDSSLENTAGTVAPNGALHVTGDYTQAAAGTLALHLRSTSDGDSVRVDGSASLNGTLEVATSYSPAAAATPLALATPSKPAGAFAKTAAPLSGGRAWTATYGAAGVRLAVGSAAGVGGANGPASVTAPSLKPRLPIVGGSTRCLPGTWKRAHELTYQWLLGSKPIAHATGARYVVAATDRGRRLACRVTATATGGQRDTATSEHARARLGLRITGADARPGGGVVVSLRCAHSEVTCEGSLRIVVDGHVVAAGRFSASAPGADVRLAAVGTGARTGDAAVVQATYRNAAGRRRSVLRQVALTGSG